MAADHQSIAWLGVRKKAEFGVILTRALNIDRSKFLLASQSLRWLFISSDMWGTVAWPKYLGLASGPPTHTKQAVPGGKVEYRGGKEYITCSRIAQSEWLQVIQCKEWLMMVFEVWQYCMGLIVMLYAGYGYIVSRSNLPAGRKWQTLHGTTLMANQISCHAKVRMGNVQWGNTASLDTCSPDRGISCWLKDDLSQGLEEAPRNLYDLEMKEEISSGSIERKPELRVQNQTNKQLKFLRN